MKKFKDPADDPNSNISIAARAFAGRLCRIEWSENMSFNDLQRACPQVAQLMISGLFARQLMRRRKKR